MPDGEIMTAPIVDSVDGTISFEYPGVLSGRLVEGIQLRWKAGELTEAAASSNEDWLHQVLGRDPGASRIGEFAFGTNPAIDRFCRDILLDEKIGGTFHIALGRAYAECGGKNESAIHWDIVKDTRGGGEVVVDGQTVLRNGVFLL
jgi:aminopeptidase